MVLAPSDGKRAALTSEKLTLTSEGRYRGHPILHMMGGGRSSLVKLDTGLEPAQQLKRAGSKDGGRFKARRCGSCGW